MQTIDRRRFNTGLFLGFGLAGCAQVPTAAPDLIVTGLRWSEDDGATWHTGSIQAGHNVWFEADIRNQGSGPTPDGVIIGVAFRVDGGMVAWSDTHTTALPAGQTISLRANVGPDGDKYWNNAPVGTYTIRAHVDDVNRITESDESNNTFEVPVTVASQPTEPPLDYNLSYDNPPFWQDVMAVSWGASPQLTAAQLFWEQTGHFTNSSTLAAARGSANSITASGKIPIGGAQRWRQTWVYARPRSSFTNPPSWVNENLYNDPTWGAAFRAWADWIAARPQYWDKDSNGNTPQSDWNFFGGHWGHISPNMPLDPADILPGMEGNTYGDWFAHKWGQTTNAATGTGAWGLSLSDFVDGHPHFTTAQHDFNPRIVEKFQAWVGQTVPGSTISARAGYIRANLFNQWNDFWSEGYGEFFAAIEREISRNTGHPAIIYDQDNRWPSWVRLLADDPRIVLTKIPAARVVSQADFRTMQSDRAGEPPSFMIASTGLLVARTPALRLGPNLHSWGEQNPSFESGLTKFFPQYTGATRTEFGNAWLKRLWFGTGWLHIANTAGAVRRGVAWFLRGYWDKGTVDSSWINQIRSLIPTKPFGLAIYYSVAIERAYERWWGETNQSDLTKLYLPSKRMMDLAENDRVPFNYYVSDAGLTNLQAAAAPAAWIVMDRFHPQNGADLLPAAERQELEAAAPILSTTSAIAAFENPLKFSTNAVGYGFVDQNGRLVIVPTNLTSGTLNATVTIKTLANGSYKAIDLLSGAVINFSSSGGTASIPVTLSRWDTRALAITTSGGRRTRRMNVPGWLWSR